jgi:glycosidase
LSNYYVYNGVNSANPISNITASNFGTATIIQGDAARKAFGIDNTKQWRRLPKVDSGSSNSRNAWNDTSVFPSYSSSTMTGVNAGSLYEKTVFPLICDNNGSLVTKTNGVKMPNYTTQSVEEDPKTHLYIKLPTTVSNKIYVPQGKLTPSNTTT